MNPTTDEKEPTPAPEAETTDTTAQPAPVAPGYGRGGQWGSGQWGSEHNEPNDAA